MAAMTEAERGDLATGADLARRVIAMAEAHQERVPVDHALALALRTLGTVARALGQYAHAERQFRQALDGIERAGGTMSIQAAEVWNDLGMTFKYVGRFDDAQAAYHRARAILEADPDHDPEDLAALFHNLGGLAHARGAFAAAEPLARRAVEIRAAAVGPRDPSTLLDRSAHAAILDAMGRSDEAEASIRDILDDLADALGDDHPDVTVARNNLAAIVQRRGDLAEAERIYRTVIASKAARLGKDSPALAVPLNNLGTVLRAQGRWREAAARYKEAERLLQDAVEADHPNLRAVRGNLARLLDAMEQEMTAG